MFFLDCEWSGGFLIEQVDSFQLSIRSKQAACNYKKRQISLQYIYIYSVHLHSFTLHVQFIITQQRMYISVMIM